MVKSLLDYYIYYAYTKRYLILKSRNMVKFHVHIRPIFSCRVTFFLRVVDFGSVAIVVPLVMDQKYII